MIFNPDTNQVTFACFDEEDETPEVSAEQHYIDLVTEMRSLMKRIKATPNDRFPEFLWEPSQNSFSPDGYDDPHSYIIMGLGKVKVENGTEIMKSVSQLKNRYKNYFDYIDALEVWQRYHDFIVETYGSFKFFEELVENDDVAFPLKKRPKLKNAKANKHLLEIDVPVSRIDRSQGVSDEVLIKLGAEMPPQLTIYEDYYEYTEYLAKFNKAEELRLQRNSRIKGFRKTTSVGSPEGEAILNYLSGELSTAIDYGSARNRPLSDDIEAFHEYDGYGEELKNELLGLRSSIKIDPNYGYLVETGHMDDEMDVYKELASAGWDVGQMIQNSSMDKKSVKLITNAIGVDEHISSKKAKKMKKKRMKAERKLYEQLSSDENVRSILTKNKITFSPEDNMISFTAKDVFN